METNGGESLDKKSGVTLRSKSDSALMDMLAERLSKPGVSIEAVLEEAKGILAAPAAPAAPDDRDPSQEF